MNTEEQTAQWRKRTWNELLLAARVLPGAATTLKSILDRLSARELGLPAFTNVFRELRLTVYRHAALIVIYSRPETRPCSAYEHSVHAESVEQCAQAMLKAETQYTKVERESFECTAKSGQHV